MEVLRSPDNAAFKALSKLLKDGRARREASRAVVEGPHLVVEALRAGVVRELWVTPEAMEGKDAPTVFKAARAAAVREKLIAAALLRRLSDSESPQGWLAVVDTVAAKPQGRPTLTLALDALQDPGNLGTLLRCAWAAQASLLLGPGCADPWSPKVLRAGVGAHFHVSVQTVSELPSALKSLAGQGVVILATSPRAAASYLDVDLKRPLCLVLGAEGAGLSPEVAAVAKEQLSIPYPGGAESLNAAVSGAIVLFEALRQRRA